jgi:hypothetical protein
MTAADVVSEFFFARKEPIAIRILALLNLFSPMLLIMQIQLLGIRKRLTTGCNDED